MFVICNLEIREAVLSTFASTWPFNSIERSRGLRTQIEKRILFLFNHKISDVLKNAKPVWSLIEREYLTLKWQSNIKGTRTLTGGSWGKAQEEAKWMSIDWWYSWEEGTRLGWKNTRWTQTALIGHKTPGAALAIGYVYQNRFFGQYLLDIRKYCMPVI